MSSVKLQPPGRSTNNRLTAATIDEQSSLVAHRLAIVINPTNGPLSDCRFTECATRVTSFRYCFRWDRLNTEREPEPLEQPDRSSKKHELLYLSVFFPQDRRLVSRGWISGIPGLERPMRNDLSWRLRCLLPGRKSSRCSALPTCCSSLPPLRAGNDRCAGCHRERGWLVRLTDCSSSVLTCSFGIQVNFWCDIAEPRDDRIPLWAEAPRNSVKIRFA